MPGNIKSLWHAVKSPKNVGEAIIPENISLNNVPVTAHDISEQFARFFEGKYMTLLVLPL